jgi:hypothetical protein
MQRTTSNKQLLGLLTIIALVGLMVSGCEDTKPPVVIAPPVLSVVVKPLPPAAPQGDINQNVALGVWVYNDSGDSLAGYHFSVWVTPDSIASVTPPKTTWMAGDLSQPNGVTGYDIFVIGKKYGDAYVHCSARDANNIVGEGSMKFTVLNSQGR